MLLNQALPTLTSSSGALPLLGSTNFPNSPTNSEQVLKHKGLWAHSIVEPQSCLFLHDFKVICVWFRCVRVYFFRFMHWRYTQQIRNVTKEMGDLKTMTEDFLVHIMSDWKLDNHTITILILLKSLILSHFFSWYHSMGTWEIKISLPVDQLILEV